MEADFSEPLRFKYNRVKRLYLGGSGIDRLRGIEGTVDSDFPEDWIASCVEANSRGFYAPGHGLSTVLNKDGSEVPFPELLKKYPEEMLGAEHIRKFGENPGVLTKLLDSSIRLPLQVHPDRTEALRLFNSPYGKTEAWIILSTREIRGETPYILLGFNKKLNRELFRSESVDGQYQTGLDMLHKIEVKPGDVYVVYGRMPHAIGPGITMVEVMEPTDFTINPEKLCGDKEISPDKRFAKLESGDALDIFDFTPCSKEEVIRHCAPHPELIEKRQTGEHKRIIPGKKVKFFEAQTLIIDGVWDMDLSNKRFRTAIITEGTARVNSEKFNAGDSFFIPCAMKKCRLDGKAKITVILPPENKD